MSMLARAGFKEEEKPATTTMASTTRSQHHGPQPCPASSSSSPTYPPSGYQFSPSPFATPAATPTTNQFPGGIGGGGGSSSKSSGGSDSGVAVRSRQQHQPQHQHQHQQRQPPLAPAPAPTPAHFAPGSLIPRDYLSHPTSNAKPPHPPQPHPQPASSSSSSSSPTQPQRNYQWQPPPFSTRGTTGPPPSIAISSQPPSTGGDSSPIPTPNLSSSASASVATTSSLSTSPVSPLSTGAPTASANRDGTADRSPVSPLAGHELPSQPQTQSQRQPQQPQQQQQQKQPSSGGAAGSQMSQFSTPDQLRKDAAPSASASGSGSSSARGPPPQASSNPSVASAMADIAAGSRKVPRTSSIDSAISTLSSASTSQKSLDASTVSPGDIANLVSAAGSPEAVIIHLLKEKQHAEAQNSQLWKLVDKQRTMVFALNKDLERATKEKEKYRKRLKEIQSNPSAASALTEGIESRPATREDTATSMKEIGKSEEGSPLAADSEKPLQHDDSPKGTQTKGAVADQTNQSSPASTTATQQNVSSSAGRRDMSTSSRSTPSDVRRTEQLLLDQDRPGSNLSNPQPRVTMEAPSLQQSNKTEASPTSYSSSAPTPVSNPPPVPPPARRPPPAPLNLEQADKARPNLEIENRDRNHEHDSESDYDDIMADDEIPSFERGRRKTREDDDKHRVALMIQEQEAARSSSNKKKAKSIDPPAQVQQEQAQGGFQGMGLPASPRAALSGQSSPIPGRQGARSPPEPMSSFLSPVGSDSSSTARNQPPKSPALSPGLPQSPRPGDRPPGAALPRKAPDQRSTMGSPPTSPKNTFPAPAPAPRSPLPPAPGPPGPLSPVDTSGARMSKTNSPQDQSPRVDHSAQNIPVIDSSVQIDSPSSLPRQLPGSIYRGLMSEDYPNLLLSPDALPSIDIKVSSSRLRPSRNSYLGPKPSEEDPVFTLSVISRATGSELWRVEKVIMALPQLDQQIRQSGKFSFKLPERSIFSGHSPAKIDARRAALNTYFEALLNTPMDENAALTVCQFLTADAIEPRDDESNFVNSGNDPKPVVQLGPDGKPKMEGYLTKRGKNFGGWKSRYFVLSGPEFKYYESPGGPHMGTIKLPHAQIGKQSQASKNSNNSNQSPSRQEDDSDNQYRHAFLILEPKRKDSNALVRHVLCAESDAERDAWVDTLLTYVEDNTPSDLTGVQVQKHPQEPEQQQQQQPPHSKSQGKRMLTKESRKSSKDVVSSEPEQGDGLRAFSYDDVVAAEAPVRGGAVSGSGKSVGLGKSNSLSEENASEPPMSPTLRTISGPTNGVKIQDAGAWGNKNPSSVKEKKRSIWGFRAQSSADLANVGRQDSIGSTNTGSRERHHELARPVFGLPLAEAVESCGPRNIDCGLPAVVYRCIEYLQDQHAEEEEGLFRLSGSNVVIKSLKERFNTEGDFDIRDSNHHYDVHAVASLFKQYLRELPTTVLTKELHLDFIHVLDLKEKEDKIAAFHVLVHRLPVPNLTLLRALSKFLLVIVNNSEINKMTLRNVGIVFAPTLNIPAPVFSMFLTHFDVIFGDNPPEWVTAKTVKLPSDNNATSLEVPQQADDIRSPRHQMFSDLPTPAYSSFPTPRQDTPDGNGRVEAAHRDNRESDTGFIPIQPTYDQPASAAEMARQQYQQPPPRNRHSEVMNSQYGSMNGMVGHNGGPQHQPRSKKRESSTLFMGFAGRKSSMPVIRDEQGMVAEDPAFE